jgi:hypothetical protein
LRKSILTAPADGNRNIEQNASKMILNLSLSAHRGVLRNAELGRSLAGMLQ